MTRDLGGCLRRRPCSLASSCACHDPDGQTDVRSARCCINEAGKRCPARTWGRSYLGVAYVVLKSRSRRGRRDVGLQRTRCEKWKGVICPRASLRAAREEGDDGRKGTLRLSLGMKSFCLCGTAAASRKSASGQFQPYARFSVCVEFSLCTRKIQL